MTLSGMPPVVVGVSPIAWWLTSRLFRRKYAIKLKRDPPRVPCMATDSDVDTSRTVVQVYVPAYQRDLWDEHADELDMSRSEFVKAMVQAGRNGFGGETPVDVLDNGSHSSDDSASEDELRDRILDCFSEEEVLSWDDLLAAVTGDIESRLESTLQELQEEGQLRYSGREGGYVLEEGE